MGDIDPTNASFSSYFERVHRPANADNPAAVLKWLEQFIGHALKPARLCLGERVSPIILRARITRS